MAKQVSPHQLELLLDFMGQHRTLALGHVRGKERNVLSNRLWLECSKILNTDSEGAQKSADKWKKYYNQYKSRVKAKARAIKQGLKGTNEGSAESAVLTPLEERLCSIVGGSGSPFNTTDDPLDGLANNNTGDGHDDESQSKDAHFTGKKVADSEQPEEYNLAPHVSIEPAVDCDKTEYIDPAPAVDCGHTGDNIKSSPSKRRHRRRRSFSPLLTERCLRSTSPKVSKRFDDFEQRFTSMEQNRIEIDRELATAIKRQATAMEAFVGQIKRFVDIYERNSQQDQAPDSPPQEDSEEVPTIKVEPL